MQMQSRADDLELQIECCDDLLANLQEKYSQKAHMSQLQATSIITCTFYNIVLCSYIYDQEFKMYWCQGSTG